MLDVATFEGLRSVLSGPRFEQIVRLFRETGHGYVGEMESAFHEGRIEDLDRAAHTLKSSAALLGAIELSRICRGIEATTREGRAPSLEEVLRARSGFEAALACMDDALL